MKISENQLSWKSDTFCRSENAPVIKNKSGIKYEARKMTTQFTKLQQFLSRGALGPIRNRKTVEKKPSRTKKPKKFDQDRKPHAKLSKPIHFHIPVIKTLIDPIQW